MTEQKPYVPAADFVRAVTVVSVVGVHATWYMAAGGQWLVSGAALALLHYSRESFMTLTGFVLTYSLFGRPVRWFSVLKKRYRLVLFPYLIWTAVYMLAFTPYRPVGAFALRYGRNLLTGGGWFHLYYLLITMQFYVMLPFFLRLMRIAQTRPRVVAWAAILFEVALTTYDQYGLSHHPKGINAYTGVEVWSYAAYFILGGIGALYWPVLRAWLRQRLTLIILVTAGAAFVMLAVFVLQVKIYGELWRADAVIQPLMVFWSLSVVLLLTALGIRYEDVSTYAGRRWQPIKWIAHVSFGIYLIHPLFLQVWCNVVARLGWTQPSYVLDGVTVVLLVVVCGMVSQLLSWTPQGAWLIGRGGVPPAKDGLGVWRGGRLGAMNWIWVRPRGKSPR